MKIFGYVRVSTTDQCKGKSIQSQEKDIKDYCRLCGKEVDKIFSDIAVSGTIYERKGLISMLDSLTADEPCLIVVQSVDRLWRTEFVMSKTKNRIKNANADVVSIMQPLYSIYRKTELIDSYNSNLDFSAEESRKEIITKFAKARKVKAQFGNKPCGTVPIGYYWDKNKVKIDREQSEIVKDIFRMCFEYGGNLSQIRRMCEKAGYKTCRGKTFSVQSVKNILRNDFYIGIVTYDNKKFDGEHEPIIDKETFDKANALLIH